MSVTKKKQIISSLNRAVPPIDLLELPDQIDGRYAKHIEGLEESLPSFLKYKLIYGTQLTYDIVEFMKEYYESADEDDSDGEPEIPREFKDMTLKDLIKDPFSDSIILTLDDGEIFDFIINPVFLGRKKLRFNMKPFSYEGNNYIGPSFEGLGPNGISNYFIGYDFDFEPDSEQASPVVLYKKSKLGDVIKIGEILDLTTKLPIDD